MLKCFLIIISLLILFPAAVMIIDNHRVVVRRYEISSRKLRHRYRIVFVADLHEKCLGEDNRKIVDRIARRKPSFILVGGDLIISKKVWQAESVPPDDGRCCSRANHPPAEDQESVPQWMRHSFSFMRQLCEIAPVYFIDGNHEIRMHEEYLFGNGGTLQEGTAKESGADIRYGMSYRIFRTAMENLGVRFLDDTDMNSGFCAGYFNGCAGSERTDQNNVNISSEHNWHGCNIELADDLDLQGLNLPMYYYRKFRKTEMPDGEVDKLLHRRPDPLKYTVLLTHSPVYFEQYARWGADLTLCGHVHGGLMRLPVIGGVVGTRPNLFPKYSGGEYSYKGGTSEGDRQDQKLIVNCGLGVHTLPIRIFNPGEISVIDLLPDGQKLHSE